jgi:molybdate transport system substrate-binding protein
MTKISLVLLAVMTSVGGLSCRGNASLAADLKVLTSVALTSVLDELAPAFEKATGDKLNIGYSLIADVRKRILDGETADVIMLSRPVMDELQRQNKFAANSLMNVAGTPVSIVSAVSTHETDWVG